MTKTLYVLSAIALVAIGFALGVFGAHVGNNSGQVGATAFDALHQGGNIYQGLSDTLIAQNGVLVGPINTGSNTLKVGSSGATVTNILVGSASYNPPSLADGVVATTTITVTGAVVGDTCAPGFSTYGTIGGIMVGCQVSATNTALVTMDNESGVTQDNATGTLMVRTSH